MFNLLTYFFVFPMSVLDPPTPKNEGEVKEYVRCLRTIDNQRTLNSLSQKLEPRRS